MDLKERINESVKGNSEEMLSLVKQFDPLLKKYTYYRQYEDAYPDLQLKLLVVFSKSFLKKTKRKITLFYKSTLSL